MPAGRTVSGSASDLRYGNADQMNLCASRVNQRFLILTLFLLHVFQHRHKGQFGLLQPVQVVNDIPHQEIFGAHRVADAVDNFVHPFQYAIQNIPARYVYLI